MMRPLFSGEKDVSKEEVMNKLQHFLELTNKGMGEYDTDMEKSLEIARELRRELREEHKNNSLVETGRVYARNKFFSTYASTIHKACASVTGIMNREKLMPFLYDVDCEVDWCRTELKEM